jgi:HAD superfamily hydrolase (TIGR01549 family)
MYKHIIWDFDGTLFDTYPVMAGVFKDLLQESGFDEPLHTILENMKVSMSYAIKIYKDQYHISDEFLNKYDAIRKETEYSKCKPYEGIEDICDYIHTSGRNNYLYTHRGESALLLLDKFGLKNHFRDFITSQQGFARKPSPDAIRYLIGKHQLQPEDTIMIGDRDLDIQAAVNAGIHSCYFNEFGKSVKADYEITGYRQLFDIL